MRPRQLSPVLLVLLVSACQEQGQGTAPAAPAPTPPAAIEKVEHKAPQYPASNRRDDNYRPGPGWTLVWSDEFEGSELNPANWNRQVEPAGRFNEEWQRYTDSTDNAYIDKGCLVVEAIHLSDGHGMGQYTSARLNTAQKQAWTYGKIAARIQLPYGEGVWPAFWMLGANIDENGGDTPWPQAGEIDILEFYGSRDESVVEANIHYAGRLGEYRNMGAKQYRLAEGRFPERFHVFEIEWDAEEISWFVDGERYAETAIAGPDFHAFHEDFFILLNLAVGGRFAGRPDDSTRFPQKMYVDWVRVYQRN